MCYFLELVPWSFAALPKSLHYVVLALHPVAVESSVSHGVIYNVNKGWRETNASWDFLFRPASILLDRPGIFIRYDIIFFSASIFMLFLHWRRLTSNRSSLTSIGAIDVSNWRQIVPWYFVFSTFLLRFLMWRHRRHGDFTHCGTHFLLPARFHLAEKRPKCTQIVDKMAARGWASRGWGLVSAAWSLRNVSVWLELIFFSVVC